MAVLRKNKVKNFTVIDNNIFKNRELSLKARGLLCTMLSLPDNWEYSLNGLCAILPDGITTIRSSLKELAEHGYFDRYREYEDGKLAGVVYVVSETPMQGNLNLENLKQENLNQENQPQLNTNINKEKKKPNKDIYASVPEEIKDVFMEWAEMRGKIKKPILSEGTVTRALNKLNSLSKNTEKQIEIIEYAIDKNWLSFYPISESSNKKSQPEPPRYKQFEPEPEVDTCGMPDDMKEKYRGFVNGL